MTYADLCREAAMIYMDIEGQEYPKEAAHLRALADLLDRIERPQVDEVWGNGHVNCSDTLYALIDPLSEP